MLSLYEALGVSPDASTADIKAAYHALVLRLHPDKSQQRSQEPGCTRKSQSREPAECQQELAHNGQLYHPQPGQQQGGEGRAMAAVADGPMQQPAVRTAVAASKQDCGLKTAPQEADAAGVTDVAGVTDAAGVTNVAGVTDVAADVTDVAAGATAAHGSADGADERYMRFQQVQAAWQVCTGSIDLESSVAGAVLFLCLQRIPSTSSTSSSSSSSQVLRCEVQREAHDRELALCAQRQQQQATMSYYDELSLEEMQASRDDDIGGCGRKCEHAVWNKGWRCQSAGSELDAGLQHQCGGKCGEVSLPHRGRCRQMGAGGESKIC